MIPNGRITKKRGCIPGPLMGQTFDTVGRDVIYGHDVILNPQYKARVEGISDDGGLMLRLDEGHEIHRV